MVKYILLALPPLVTQKGGHPTRFPNFFFFSSSSTVNSFCQLPLPRPLSSSSSNFRIHPSIEMQFSWFAAMVVLFSAIGANSAATTSSATSTTSAATTAKGSSSSSAASKPTKNAAAGNAVNNPFAFLREL
ncbi:hypothetical protein BDV28DRAFT_134714 [Aspergillus coremiiformis]|uniref:Uncharacterized protein n=1 Tax=Aspergillus coremiiformis TaxID=138285 RepID=A0A5N6Z7L4_9EURO|nr:hypothetical protein BDV28DRAFT_134714 [Aspergillus coremiiformis]